MTKHGQPTRTPRTLARCLRLLAGAALVLSPVTASATPPSPPGGVTFQNIANTPSTGITYRRTPSTIKALYDAITAKPFMAWPEQVAVPIRFRGAPGVALIDYDRDGDLDLYVTNGPNTHNSLYKNKFKETGTLSFEDVGAASGASAYSQDSTGVCFGDIDNDGDDDLLVLGRMESNRLFRNEGNGTFTDITATSNIGGGARAHTGCSMGDVNGDGLLDVVVGNSFDWARQEAIFTEWYSYSQPNDLYINQGGNTFSDVSDSSGIRNLYNVPPGDGTITLAIAMVDYDQDGDMDIIHADDQGAMAESGFAGRDRGMLQVLKNDGTGHFTPATKEAGTGVPSTWMGLSFGDINCDGYLDIFSSSLGDYAAQQYGIAEPPGFFTSRWHLNLGAPGGKFSDPGVGQLVASPFGWGNSMTDYDNDGDTDIVFFGQLDFGPFISADNPGTVLRNEGCSAQFTWDKAATAADAEFNQRNETYGLSVGDLNDDGFVDLVHVSSQYAQPSIPLVPMLQQWGSVFDETAMMVPTFTPIGPLEWEWSGYTTENGTLSVDLNSGDNGNKSVKVDVKGTKGLTTHGKVNRDGIGAFVQFTPRKGQTSMTPVLGGSSYLSQHPLVQQFGLGKATRGTVEVIWPGKVHNRLYNVTAGERVLIPEIPCDFVKSWPSKNTYKSCVNAALNELVSANVITSSQRDRLRDSAEDAYDDEH